MQEKYDLIIIGSGPAGLTSGIYAGRYMLKTLILGQIPGGTASEAHKVCNFPSHEEISGFELIHKMLNQAKKLGIEINQEEVTEINGKNNDFEIKTNKKKYYSKKIIIATGTKRKNLNLENEEKFIGKGISYCATCDSGFFKDKTVGVVGGGNAALTAALLLSKFAKKVYIIYRKEKFSKAEPAWIKEVQNNEKIKPLFQREIKKLIGREKLEQIELDDNEKINLEGLFIEIGSISNKHLAEKFEIQLENGMIVVDKKQKTNIEGIYAAGDITNNPLKQIITACAEGAIASTTAYAEIVKRD